MALLTILYGLVVLGFSIYAVYFLWLSLLPTSSPLDPTNATNAELPHVTVQLPIYNEKHVAARVISAACALDYPLDRLQIQVLDDSTDDTLEIVAQCVASWRQEGRNVEQVRRLSRDGYKAGALEHGLAYATGEFVAIFDADFVPEPGWLRHTVAHFCRDDSARLGLVQTRWRHLNGNESALTRAQETILDDFALQQAARTGGGLMPVFNGSAGLWRRDCITEAGGWSGRTLSEDLDLSYRAHLAGWTAVYDSTVLVAAEIPARMSSFKQQQYRWAKGSLQATRLLIVRLLRAPLSWRKKADAVLFLTGNVVHLLLVLILLLKLPLLIWPTSAAIRLDMLLTLGVVGMVAPGLYGWAKGQRSAPFDAVLQCGIAPTGSRGVLAGFWGPLGGEFQRTPKAGSGGLVAPDKRTFDFTLLGELALLGVAVAGLALALLRAQWFALPILVLHALGLAWVCALQIGEARLRP